MSFFEYALIGFFVGIITTAPVGPVNIMAIQHAVHGGFRQGVFVGLGAVVADTIFAAAAISASPRSPISSKASSTSSRSSAELC